MKKSSRVLLLEDYLNELFPNSYCELNFTRDYELLLAVVMSAQTTDKRVNSVNKILFNKYKSLIDFENASIEDIEDIIKPIGTYKKKAQFIKEITHKLLIECDGKVPNSRKVLSTFPGVGRKTINVVLAVLFNVPNIAVDTHVERVSKRLSLAKENDNVVEVENKIKKCFKKENWIERHHQLVFFGRYHCKAISPLCSSCKLKNICKYKG